MIARASVLVPLMFALSCAPPPVAPAPARAAAATVSTASAPPPEPPRAAPAGTCPPTPSAAPIAVTDPSAKHRAEQALFEALEPSLRACLAKAPAMRFEIRLEFAPTGKHEPIELEYQRASEVDCVTQILEARACLPPIEEGWYTTWTFCARGGCGQNPYCTLCVE